MFIQGIANNIEVAKLTYTYLLFMAIKVGILALFLQYAISIKEK
jgi:hypothetical protein